jgi:hypothetical protein
MSSPVAAQAMPILQQSSQTRLRNIGGSSSGSTDLQPSSISFLKGSRKSSKRPHGGGGGGVVAHQQSVGLGSSAVPCLVQRVVAVCAILAFVVSNVVWMQQYLTRSDTASVRKYAPHRYYQLQLTTDQQPDFLTTLTEYIYGEWPIVLPIQKGPVKLPVDQSEWWSSSKEQQLLPFADGTNPSILSLARISTTAPTVAAAVYQRFPDAAYLATVCMTESQCRWKEEDEATTTNKITQKLPSTIRTLVLVLNQQFQPLDQTTVRLERNAPWGKKLKAAVSDSTDPNYWYLPALDDARLFVHDQHVWVSYREGRGFGYEQQVLNPIHFEFEMKAAATTTWQAYIRASETTAFCCGRNMALMESVNGDPTQLMALTWVDPVTTVVVDTTPILAQQQQQRRRLDSTSQKQPHKSHIHGTNAFMVELPPDDSAAAILTKTYLGVAHFHRPNDRSPNIYARFGHHYTHAFYTVAVVVVTKDDKENENTQQLQLTGLSAEFVLPSAHAPTDAEIIQFASGLEYQKNTNDEDGVIVIAYGINDCEAAVTTVELKVVRRMLQPVPAGKQVVDFMKPLERKRS